MSTTDGFTVYRFARDSASPPTSNCDGQCAQTWLPVLANEQPWLKGISPDDVGTVARADGTHQLTLGGWPVYRYAQDTAPGDTKGHGVGGIWCAMGPTGAPVAGSPNTSPTAPASSPSSSSSTGPGAGPGPGRGY